MNLEYKYNMEENEAFNLKKIHFSNNFEELIANNNSCHTKVTKQIKGQSKLYGGPQVQNLDKKLKKNLLGFSEALVNEIPKRYLFFYAMMKHLELLSKEIEGLTKTSLNI